MSALGADIFSCWTLVDDFLVRLLCRCYFLILIYSGRVYRPIVGVDVFFLSLQVLRHFGSVQSHRV